MQHQTTEPLPLIIVRLPPKHPDGRAIMWDWVLGKWVTLHE